MGKLFAILLCGMLFVACSADDSGKSFTQDYIESYPYITYGQNALSQKEEHSQTQTPTSSIAPKGDLDFITKLNSYRASQGLQQVQFSDSIWQVAFSHSKYQASIKDITHEGFDSRVKTLRTQIKNVGGAAENVAYGWGDFSAENVFEAWKNSKGHDANMKGDYNMAAAASYKSSDSRCYWTLILLKAN